MVIGGVVLALLLAHLTPSSARDLAFAPAFRGNSGFILDPKRAIGPLAPLRSGPPSWVPWPGTNDPIIDTDRDVMLRRERCILCRGKGVIFCRWCTGKGSKHLRSRSLRNSQSELREGELLSCDPLTGLWRAIEVAPCLHCHRTGLMRCSLCKGSGNRVENATLGTVWEDNPREDPPDPVRYTGGRR